MDFLSDIIARKRKRVEQARQVCKMEELRSLALQARKTAGPHALRSALEKAGLHIIAEVKRASPSRGAIRADVDPAAIARLYEAGGAAAISVLTEEDRFLGSLEDLRAVRRAVSLPVLRKDFIFDEYQLYEAAAAGADALLLIVAALDDKTLTRLRLITEEELKMDALVEVHTADELQRAILSGASLIGVNNRDLHSFSVSLDVSLSLAQQMSPDVLAISESGLRSSADLAKLSAAGYRGFLVGETLMRAEHPDVALRRLLEPAEDVERVEG